MKAKTNKFKIVNTIKAYKEALKGKFYLTQKQLKSDIKQMLDNENQS